METLEALILYMAHLIEEQQVAGKTLRDLGAEWGVSHAALAILRRHLRGGGRHIETRIAEAVAGGDITELRKRAKAWHSRNPGWRPRGYKPPNAQPKNRDFPWWEEEAAKVSSAKSKLAWAVAAAAEKPQSDEPRAERRRAYVERAAENILDLPEKTVATLERRYGKDSKSR